MTVPALQPERESPPGALAPREPGLSGRWNLIPAREGAIWIGVALAVPRVAGAVATILLRRFLGPGIAGTFDLALVPYQALDGVRTIGTGPALVFQERLDRAVANTAWTLNLLVAVALAGIAQLLAHPLALYYGHPAVEPIIRVLSLAYIFSSLSSVHYFLLLRDRNFRARSIPALGQVLAASSLALLLALWGFGIGALVVRELASAATGAVLLWAIYPFRPHLQLLRRPALQLLRYGLWVSGGAFLLFLSQNVDVFIGGHVIRSTQEIGFYTTSWSVAFIAAGVVTTISSSMVFPTLSRLQHDRPALQVRLLVAIRQLALVMLPAALLLAVLAPVVIVPVLGQKWEAYRSSFLVLSLLAIYAGNRTLLAVFFEGYKAVGKPWLVPAYNGIKLVVMIPAMVVGAQHGILGLALTYIPIQLAEIPLALHLAQRILHVSPAQVCRAARTPVLAAVLTALLVAGIELELLRGLHQADAITLAIGLVAGVGSYFGILRLLDGQVLREAGNILVRGL